MAFALASLPSLMSLFGVGSAIGGIAGLGSNVISSIANASANKRSYHFQRNLLNLQAKLNYKYQQKMSQWSSLNVPAYARQGLENAGYNPILAFNSGSNFVNAGGTYSSGGSAQQASPVDYNLL